MKRLIKLLCPLMALFMASCATAPAITPTAATTPDTSAQNEYGKNTNLLVGVDQLGRTFAPVSGFNEEKYVGMFYFLWVGQERTFPKDMSEYFKTQEGIDDLLNPAGSETAPLNKFYFWGQPLFGYYNMQDEYVLRKHIEMLTLAGVDFLYLDATNGVTYDAVWRKLLPLIEEYRNAGWDAPRVVFYTHSRSILVAKKLYKDLYSKNFCPDAWFTLDGKPLMIAYTDPAQDRAALKKELGGTLPKDYENSPSFTEKELAFFTFRTPQWPNEPRVKNGFPWMEWEYPNKIQGDVCNVSLAQHPQLPMSFSYLRGNTNWGRGWNGTKNNANKLTEGPNFINQFETAISQDPRIITVTGWNEWQALKFVVDGDTAFVDAFLEEYSRDIEPMRGGYEDSYLQRLIYFVRKFKGTAAAVASEPAEAVTLTDGWDKIKSVYYPVGSANYGRSFSNATRTAKYEQPAPENNISSVQVAHDQTYLYFRITCEEPIAPDNGQGNWINVFIGTGQPERKGFEGYEYVLNRTAGMLSRCNPDGTATALAAIESSLSGQTLTLRVKRADITLTGPFSLYFKVASGVANPQDIMDYYVTGSTVPMGRLSYAYAGR